LLLLLLLHCASDFAHNSAALAQPAGVLFASLPILFKSCVSRQQLVRVQHLAPLLLQASQQHQLPQRQLLA
jgi:hypothetical protein